MGERTNRGLRTFNSFEQSHEKQKDEIKFLLQNSNEDPVWQDQVF